MANQERLYRRSGNDIRDEITKKKMKIMRTNIKNAIYSYLCSIGTQYLKKHSEFRDTVKKQIMFSVNNFVFASPCLYTSLLASKDFKLDHPEIVPEILELTEGTNLLCALTSRRTELLKRLLDETLAKTNRIIDDHTRNQPGIDKLMQNIAAGFNRSKLREDMKQIKENKFLEEEKTPLSTTGSLDAVLTKLIQEVQVVENLEGSESREDWSLKFQRRMLRSIEQSYQGKFVKEIKDQCKALSNHICTKAKTAISKCIRTRLLEPFGNDKKQEKLVEELFDEHWKESDVNEQLSSLELSSKLLKDSVIRSTKREFDKWMKHVKRTENFATASLKQGLKDNFLPKFKNKVFKMINEEWTSEYKKVKKELTQNRVRRFTKDTLEEFMRKVAHTPESSNFPSFKDAAMPHLEAALKGLQNIHEVVENATNSTKKKKRSQGGTAKPT